MRDAPGPGGIHHAPLVHAEHVRPALRTHHPTTGTGAPQGPQGSAGDRSSGRWEAGAGAGKKLSGELTREAQWRVAGRHSG